MASVQTIAPIIVACTVNSAATQFALTSLAIRVSTFAFQNNGTASVYLGGSSVVAAGSAGFTLAAGETIILGEQERRMAREQFDPANYYAIAGTTCNCILFYNEIAARR